MFEDVKCAFSSLWDESQQRQYYNVSGDHSIYMASYSGFKYASCLSFVSKMLRKADVVVPEDFPMEVVQLPKNLKEKFEVIVVINQLVKI